MSSHGFTRITTDGILMEIWRIGGWLSSATIGVLTYREYMWLQAIRQPPESLGPVHASCNSTLVRVRPIDLISPIQSKLFSF